MTDEKTTETAEEPRVIDMVTERKPGEKPAEPQVVELRDEVSLLRGQIILLQNQLTAAIDAKYAALAQLEKQPTMEKQQQILVDLGVAGKNVSLNVNDERVAIIPNVPQRG